MVILTARKASRSPDTVHPGLVLHGESGITPAAEAILRGGQSTSGVSNTA
jgi:tRNA1(Val) A37 N6-methylase TrmN6